MDRAELGKIVGWRLGDRDDMEERIDTELEYLQDYVLEANEWLPWFLESEISTASTVAGEERLTLPQDFLGEVEESHLYIKDVDGNSLELAKKDPDVARRLVGGGGEGRPRYYAISGLYFQFFPTPDATYDVQMRFYAKDARLTDPTKVSKWFTYAGDVVVAELLYLLTAKHIKDAEAAAGFAGDAKNAWNRLYTIHTARMETNQPRSLGGNT